MNKIFSLKTKNKYHRQNISQSINLSTKHLKLKQRIDNLFFSFLLHLRYDRRNNTDIGYLCHTDVTVAEPATPPSLSALPNFAVNK